MTARITIETLEKIAKEARKNFESKGMYGEIDIQFLEDGNVFNMYITQSSNDMIKAKELHHLKYRFVSRANIDPFTNQPVDKK